MGEGDRAKRGGGVEEDRMRSDDDRRTTPPPSAHPGESRDPVLSSLTPAFQDDRACLRLAPPSPKALGPGFRRDERI